MFPFNASNNWTDERIILTLCFYYSFDNRENAEDHAPIDPTLHQVFTSFFAVFQSPNSKLESEDFKLAWRCLKPIIDPARSLELKAILLKIELEGSRDCTCADFLQALPPFVEKFASEPASDDASESAKYTQLKLDELSFKDWRVPSATELERMATIFSSLPIHVFKMTACVT